MNKTITIDQITDEKTKAYDEGWNSALYTIVKKIEKNPMIRLEDLKEQIQYMGK